MGFFYNFVMIKYLVKIGLFIEIKKINTAFV